VDPKESISPEEDYFNEWSALLAKAHQEKDKEEKKALMFFCIGATTYAIAVKSLAFVAEEQEVRAVPHHEQSIFQGMANISGNLVLSFSLHALLGVEENTAKTLFKRRALILEDKEELCAFSVDSIAGTFSIPKAKLQDSKSSDTYIKAVFNWGNERVHYLDEKGIVEAFKKGIQNARR
jgi:chemotaxis signal transduction protein